MLNPNRHEADDTLLDERVVSLLSAAAAPSEPGPLPGEGAALAAFRSAQVPTRRSSMLSSLIAAKAGVAAAIGAGVLLTGGVAAAATGTLPGAAQDTARDVLSNFGVTVPGSADASAGHADTRGKSAGPGDIALVPRGMKFRVKLLDEEARGYVAENHGLPFRLPDLGPIGSNGLANARDFLAPVAAYEDVEGGFELVHQSVAVLPHWLVRGDAQGRWSATLQLVADTSQAESRMHTRSVAEMLA